MFLHLDSIFMQSHHLIDLNANKKNGKHNPIKGTKNIIITIMILSTTKSSEIMHIIRRRGKIEWGRKMNSYSTECNYNMASIQTVTHTHTHAVTKFNSKTMAGFSFSRELHRPRDTAQLVGIVVKPHRTQIQINHLCDVWLEHLFR